MFAFHSSIRTTVLNAPNGLYVLKKTLSAFSLPVLFAAATHPRQDGFILPAIHLPMPGHFERHDGHFRQPFFGAALFSGKSAAYRPDPEDLPVFSFRCQTVTPAAPMDGTAAQVTMFCWSSAVDRSPGSGTARILFVIPSG